MLCQDDQLSSYTWLDDWAKNVYFFENVVLRRAKNDKHFTEQEMIDMIGWSIALDSVYEHESTGWIFEEVEKYSSSHIQINISATNSCKTTNSRQLHKTKEEQFRQCKPSKRMIQHLINNINLSYSSLHLFMKHAAEHIPTLNLFDADISVCLRQREELKTILKKYLVHLTSMEESSENTYESDVIAELINTIFTEKTAIILPEIVQKQPCISSHEKELLRFAILSDHCRTKKEYENGLEVQDPWRITKYFVSSILSSTKINHNEQVNLLLWLDKAMFGTASSPPLYALISDTPEKKSNVPSDNMQSRLPIESHRRDFLLSLKIHCHK